MGKQNDTKIQIVWITFPDYLGHRFSIDFNEILEAKSVVKSMKTRSQNHWEKEVSGTIEKDNEKLDENKVWKNREI